MSDYRLHATEVVGYAFNADAYCPDDILIVLDQMADPKKAGIRPDQIQPLINLWGRWHGLGNRQGENRDPNWDNSEVVPQPIFANEDGADTTCGKCGEKLIS